MQYFVSAENSSYFYWQLELLIESFLMQGIEKDLVIGLSENDSNKIRGFSSNLVKYGNKFIHSNEGREKGYLPLNRVVAIRYALAKKILSFPFTLIHSDMILRNPIVLDKDDEDYGLIINNYEETPYDEDQMVKEETALGLKKLAEEREIEEDKIPEIPFFSAPIVFTKQFEYVSETFFLKLQLNMQEILAKRGASFPCERAAWEMTIPETFQHCSSKGKFMAAPMMFEDENINFIHYKNGIPPVFHKKYFKYDQGIYYTSNGPYETIMDHNPTINTNYTHQVIRSYNRRCNK